jgi:uncharacterized protein (UPF0548 family)
MRAQLTRPGPDDLKQYLTPLKAANFTYVEVGASRGEFPVHYDEHSNRFPLGTGEAGWVSAKAAIDDWQAFATDWARIYPARAPIRAGQEVAVSFRVLGIWWKNACRIVYTIDEDQAYGFAYGTLPGHVGHGEEYFGVERDAVGQCWFVLKAFSQPAFWAARWLPFVMRWQQQRFVRAAAIAVARASARS